MLENIKLGGEKFSHPRLKICSDLPNITPLLSFIRTDRSGGEPLRQNISAIAQIMGKNWQAQAGYIIEEEGVIIGIPRGGTPMSEGLRSVFPGYNYFLSNDGVNRDAARPILPDDLTIGNSTNLLIADAVIVTGTTIINAIRAILSMTDLSNKITVFSAFASEEGVINLLKMFPELKVYIGSFARFKQHWDIHRWKLSPTLEGIPNIGELVSRS